MRPDGSELLASLLEPLLGAFEMLIFIARHFNPPDLQDLVRLAAPAEKALQDARTTRAPWPEDMTTTGACLEAASDVALQAFAGLRAAAGEEDDVRGAYRALRLLASGLEMLYPLAGRLAAVNQFFLDPPSRSDALLQQHYLTAAHADTGVMHFGEGERGDFWLYVPEHYTSDRPWPLVMALHGGSGNGRQFLWTWLTAARSFGAILASPTAQDRTWALLGPDADSPNLARILEFIRSRWKLDPGRLLLTGMSDGGTFSYVSGLDAKSPFTHLAPVAAAFHPMLAHMADPDRIRGLPIYIIHGTLDWMFPPVLARQAHAALARAGAAVTLCEVEDLSHTYPRELNGALLSWLQTAPVKPQTLSG
jgi:phospholipase/carboxylesterase